MKNRIAAAFREERPLMTVLVVAGLLVFCYWDLLFPGMVSGYASAPERPVGFLRALYSWRALLWGILFLLPVACILIRKGLQASRGDRYIRYFTGAFALWLAWQLAGEGYNFYLDSWFVADRLLLAGLAVAVCFHLAAVPLFLFFALAFYSQFFYPFGWFYTYDIRPVFNLLVIAYAVMLTGNDAKSRRRFFTVALLMQMASYFISGLGKIVISGNLVAWFTENELFLLPLGTHLAGWLEGMPGLAAWFARMLELFRFPVSLYIFLIEALCLFALRDIRYSRALLISLSGMHILIALMTGIFFWHWFLINAAMLIALYRNPEWFRCFQGRKGWLLSSALVLLACLVFHPIYYAWHDSRYRWIADLVVTDGEGNDRVFNKNGMGGYSYYFTHAEFQRLINKNIGSNNGYSASLEEVRRYRNADSGTIEAMLAQTGINHFQASYHKQVSSFLATYFRNYNENPGKREMPLGMSPLRQLQMYASDNRTQDTGLAVERVRIILREYLYEQDGNFHQVGETVILDETVTDY